MKRFPLSHLLVLNAFAVSQPLLNKLSVSAEFFVAKKAGPLDLTVLVAVLLFFLPLGFFILERAALLISQKLYIAVHSLVVALYTVCIALIISQTVLNNGKVAIGVAAALSLLALYLYLTRQGVRGFLSILWPVVLVMPIFFATSLNIRTLITSPKWSNTAPEIESSTPVVFIIFDELPLSTLLDSKSGVDKELFPNFSTLTKDFMWFKNAAAVSTHTEVALPSILTGLFPKEGEILPTLERFPRNLFTLLGKTHSFLVHEPITSLCPEELCYEKEPFIKRNWKIIADATAIYLHILTPDDLDLGLPSITNAWGDFWHSRERIKHFGFRRTGRVYRWRKQLDDFKKAKAPPLLFAHHLLPHIPYQFTPTGLTYNFDEFPTAYKQDAWLEHDFGIKQAYQQFLWQVKLSDALLGEMMQTLKEASLYDSAFIVISADHGVSFASGAHRRGDIDSESFYEDLVSIPLFIKKPGVGAGGVSKAVVSSADILPTLIHELKLGVDWKLDGSSVFNLKDRSSEREIILGERQGYVAAPGDVRGNMAFKRLIFDSNLRHDATLRWKIDTFGEGKSALERCLYCPLSDSIGFEIAKLKEILEPSNSLYLLPSQNVAPNKNEIYFKKKESFVPALLKGRFTPPSPIQKPIKVALELNGTLAATAITFPIKGKAQHRFEFLVPESMFKGGTNSSALYLIKNK